MKKILIVSIFLLSLSATAFAAAKIYPKFPDVEEGSYYEDGVYKMQRLEVISGYENGNFGPNDNVTRGQIATMLGRYDENVVNELRQENAYLKTLVCQQFEKEDYSETEYQEAWDGMCKVYQQTQ